MAFMDLHGISAAKRDVRAALAGKVNEIVLAAGAASRAGFRRRDFGVVIRPHVERKQRTTKAITPYKELQRFGGCDRGYQVHG
jgi:hypothetical protein